MQSLTWAVGISEVWWLAKWRMDGFLRFLFMRSLPIIASVMDAYTISMRQQPLFDASSTNWTRILRTIPILLRYMWAWEDSRSLLRNSSSAKPWCPREKSFVQNISNPSGLKCEEPLSPIRKFWMWLIRSFMWTENRRYRPREYFVMSLKPASNWSLLAVR